MDLLFIAAMIAIVLPGISATISEALVAKESIEIMGKSPELESPLKGLTILGVALVESAAIYGLVVALLILFTDGLGAYQALAASLTIGLVGIFTCIGESWIVVNALRALHRNPSAEGEIKGNMILFVALVESAAIYALVVSLLILFA